MEKLISRQKAADRLGLAPQTLAKWAMVGKNLTVIKLGNRTVRYSCADIEDFIRRSAAATEDAWKVRY